MPAEHFTRDDLTGAVLGTILYAPFLLAPGFLFGWACDLLDFRKLSRSWQVLVSLVLSVSVTPILVYLIGSFISNAAVWAFYAITVAFLLGILAMERRRGTRGPVPRWTFYAVGGWALVVWLSGIDIQAGDRLYPSVLAYDFNLRTALVEGISRHGLPAVSPIFFPGHFVLLRYHYFWFIATALVHRLGGPLVGARQALLAGDVWCGWALMASVVLYLRFVHPAGERGIRHRAKWGIGMLAVAGLDIFPNIFLDVANHLSGLWFVFSSAEWWNTPVTGFPHAVFFEPHHVASLIACFAAFLLLWRSRKEGRVHWPSVICGGLSLASAVGLSVYVSFTFAIFLVGWTAYVLLRGKRQEAIVWIASGLTAIAGAAAYVGTLQKAGGSGGPFALPTVRSFTPFDVVLPAFGLSWHQIAFANFLILPLNYFLETGVWFLLAMLWVSRIVRRKGAAPLAERAAFGMFVVSLLVGTFLRSGVINNNDLGWRSVLIAQFVLAVWSVDPLRAWWRLRSRRALLTKYPRTKDSLAKGSFAKAPARATRLSAPLRVWQFRIAALALCGLASTIFDFVWMRIYIPFSDTGVVATATWFTEDHQQGTRTFAVRQAYERLNHVLPSAMVLQANPYHWNDVYHGLYGLHQTASFDYTCGSVLGGDPRECEPMQKQLVTLFNDPTLSKSLDIDRVCDAWGIHVLVAKDSDPVFKDRTTWPWTRAALAENDKVRAVRCGFAPAGEVAKERP